LTSRSRTGLAACFGFALPYVVIGIAWSTAPNSIRDPLNPAREAVGDIIAAAVWGSFLLGLLQAAPWALAHPRPVIWWVGASLVLAAHVVGIFVFNFLCYFQVGGAL
jgi:hypothetical protein